jgi:nitrite reductase/ring-hydroxylating ferredoxin subunit
MARWIDVAAATDIPDGGKTCVHADGKPVVLCQVAGALHAVLNVCPHAGLPLGEGELRGKVLTCPFHGFAYNIETGRNVDFVDDVPLSKVPVRVTEEARVEVDVEQG